MILALLMLLSPIIRWALSRKPLMQQTESVP
jgi:hypothetical protein